jgi:hypothetical protein
VMMMMMEMDGVGFFGLSQREGAEGLLQPCARGCEAARPCLDVLCLIRLGWMGDIAVEYL